MQQASPASSKIWTPPIADRDPDEDQWTPRYIADVKYRRKQDGASTWEDEPPLIPPPPSYWNSPASGHSGDHPLRAGPSQLSIPDFTSEHSAEAGQTFIGDATTWNQTADVEASADYYPRQGEDPRSPMSSRMEMDEGFMSSASEELTAALLRQSLLFQGSTVDPEIRGEDQPERRPSLLEPRRVRFPSGMPESPTPSPRPIVPPLSGAPHIIGTPPVRPLSTVTAPSTRTWTPVIPPRVFSPSGSSDSSERAHTVRTWTSVPRTPGTPWATPVGRVGSAGPWNNFLQNANMTPTPAVHGAGTPLVSTQEQPSTNTHVASPPGDDADNAQKDQNESTDESPAADDATKGPAAGPSESQDMWSLYVEHTLEEDKETVEAWKDDLDSILIFAALFSAVVTTFVVESSHDLKVDDSAELLRAILLEMRASRNGSQPIGSDSGPPVPAAFSVTGSAVRVNAYWFSSLVISLAAALITILAKQWVNYLLAGLSPVPTLGARRRQYRIDGMHKWKLPTVISILPIFLHVSLLLFFVGLVEFVWDLNDLVGNITAALVATTSFLYITSNLMAYVYPDCPYKTSVAVLFGQVMSVTVALYSHLVIAIGVAWDLIRTPHSISDASNIAGAKFKAQKNDALRILALRHGEEMYITDNSGLIDARILHWLLHNESRLSDSSSLGRMLMEFPDLVRHQQLLIEDRSYALLEHNLSSWYNQPYSQLNPDRQHDVATIVRTLASIESEEDVKDPPVLSGIVSKGPAHGFRPPPLSRASSIRRSTIHKAQPDLKPRLSATSIALVRRLLEELPSLPMSLVAFTLRLGILMVAAPTGGRDWVMVSRGTGILLRRIMSHPRILKPDDPSNTDLLHAVNTVIFVALYDLSFPEWKLTLPSGRINWFITLPDLLVRSPVDVVARKQLAWAICTLTWTVGQREASQQMKQRSPIVRIPIDPAVPPLLTSLAKAMLDIRTGGHSAFDPSYDALNATLVALDRTLRDWLDDSCKAYSEDHLAVCHQLHAMYGPFLLRLYKRLSMGEFPEEQALRMLVPMTRLAVSLFLVQINKERGAYTVLLTTILCIFRSLVTSRRLPITQTPTETLDRATIHRWIYRAACAIITLYLEPSTKLVSAEPQRLPELSFNDVASTTAVALDLISALELVSKHGDVHPYQIHTQIAFLLQLFLGIMKNIFTRNILLEEGLRGGGNWDWDATRIVADFVQQGGMSLLVAASYPPVHTELFAPAVNILHTVFFGHARPPYGRLFGPATPNDRHHPANELASALVGPYTQFLRTLEDILRKGKFQDVGKEGILDKVVAIAGYVALYENPSHWPKLDVVLAMQSFFSTLLFAHAGRSLYELRLRMRNPTALQALRAKILVPETVAVGLIRILAVITGSGVFADADLHEHCVECKPTRAQLGSVRARLYGANGWVGWESKATLWAMTRAILWTIHAIWGGQDRKFMRLRRSLFDHGLAQRVRCFQRWGGEVGLLANSMAYRLGGTCRYEHTQALLLLEYQPEVEQEGGISTIS